MAERYNVRIMRSKIYNIKNVNFGEVAYMNYGSINTKGEVTKTDVVGIYGQNGSGKTALVESIDILRYIITGTAVPYDVYGGILPNNKDAVIVTDFFVEKDHAKYKVEYSTFLRINEINEKIEIYKEKLVYWQKGSLWKSERDIEFENPDYENEDLLNQKIISVKSNHEKELKTISFLWAMQNVALISAQNYHSVFFNKPVFTACNGLNNDAEQLAFRDIIMGLMQFGLVDLSVVKVNQLGKINTNQFIPIFIHRETESTITQECLNLYIAGMSEIPVDGYNQVQSAIDAINVAMRSIVPNLQIELEKKMEIERPNGTRAIQVEVYANRDNKRFLLKFESEGIKRIVSILNYLISVFNNPGICLVVDELDSGIFEYLLGELLGLMHKEMKGQLIFTSHNLRILEKLDAKNIVCSTVNPDNRYIRLTGIEKNHNKRDFYIRSITVGGQKEELYDEDDLIAMGYAFRKAGKMESKHINIKFSPEFEKNLRVSKQEA